MRGQQQKRGVNHLVIALFMCVALIGLIDLKLNIPAIPSVLVAVSGIGLGTGGFIYYLQGCVALARSKGYHSLIVGVIIIGPPICLAPFLLFLPDALFFLVLFFLIPLMALIPLIIAFGLKDKKKMARNRMMEFNAEPKGTVGNSSKPTKYS